MSGQYKVAWLCEALLFSRSGYYDWKERRCIPGPRQVENTRLRERIRQEFARSRQTYGSPRLAHALGCPGRRNRIAQLMRKERLFARQRSKYRPTTTDSRATADRLRLTASKTSPSNDPIKSGLLRPPASSPAEVGCIWSRSWISSPGASSAGL